MVGLPSRAVGKPDSLLAVFGVATPPGDGCPDGVDEVLEWMDPFLL
jgi:hypothetical protein